jgi:hypothetical protein
MHNAAAAVVTVQWDVSGLFGAVPLEHKSFKAGRVVGTGLTPVQFNEATQVRRQATAEHMC